MKCKEIKRQSETQGNLTRKSNYERNQQILVDELR